MDNKIFEGGNRQNIILAGLVYDSNLGDQAICISTKAVIEEILHEKGLSYEIRVLDLYGRRKLKNHGKDKRIAYKVINKVKSIFRGNTEDEICKRVNAMCKSTFDENTRGVIFVGGGLLKYKNQIISEPMRIVLHHAAISNIPVMLSAVGVEGYDSKNSACLAFAASINTNNIKIITTRDNIELLNDKWIINKQIKTAKVADPACSLFRYIKAVPIKKEDNLIGLGIARSGIFSDYGMDITEEKIKRMWVNIYRELIHRGYKCVLFTNGLTQDYEFAVNVCNELRKNGYPEAICIKPSKTVQELVNIIGSFKAEIVTRLHASIIGFSYNVPSVGLVWNEKQRMFAQSIGYPERFITPGDCDSAKIVDIMETAIQTGYQKINLDDYIATTNYWLNQFVENNLSK